MIHPPNITGKDLMAIILAVWCCVVIINLQNPGHWARTMTQQFLPQFCCNACLWKCRMLHGCNITHYFPKDLALIALMGCRKTKGPSHIYQMCYCQLSAKNQNPRVAHCKPFWTWIEQRINGIFLINISQIKVGVYNSCLINSFWLFSAVLGQRWLDLLFSHSLLKLNSKKGNCPWLSSV